MGIGRMAALAALVVAPGLAQAVGFGIGIQMGYRTEVTPVKDGVFEVVSYGTSAPVSYWCGAGDYAIRTLKTKVTQRIYVWKPYGISQIKPGKRAVQFSLTPPEGGDTSPRYSVTVKYEGANMTAASAEGYCYDNLMDLRF